MAGLEGQLEKFWKIEELEVVRSKTKEEEMCEEHFKNTYIRDQEGRFIVKLPQRSNVILGDSFEGAKRRLIGVEKQFQKQPELQEAYTSVMSEYEESGDMYLTENFQEELVDPFYLPHQPVIRKESMTTKLRVVLDASFSSSLGTSLNDKLMTGPNLQSDILEMLMRFRTHEFVLTADITRMFRQIHVAKEDRHLQQVLWRKDRSQPIKAYTLKTVTFGTACAPFSAMRCLRELANLNREVYPEAAEVIEKDFYMDDLLTGTKTKEEAMKLQGDLSDILMSAQFPFRKWRTNDPEILSRISDLGKTDELLVLDIQGSTKTLGLLWNSNEDVLQYNVRLPKEEKVTCKEVSCPLLLIFMIPLA
ncbi:PREDICTED: uncharacterized protein LOC105557634 [Vollenhovia emeryi]|uniref:uncharacterized protein LOC105557634 n=1 Tax=Vollenhovia emeryi TaxID=411798 RepID=UPI0005F50A8F|nr:PREDICTED: uncharacterized protein LOC105557634 [Vollenhovia emeryi]